KYIGVGEKLSALEAFHPERIASRILDMGDVVSLVEKAVESIDKQEAEDMARKLQQGQFDLDDLWSQLKNMRKMGGLASMMGMLPGIGKIKQQLGDRQIDEGILARQEAMLSSMTRKERKNPDIIKGSRKRRIAEGSGTSIPELNRLLKQHKQMSTMMKKLKKLGPKGMARMMQGMMGQ
ncbi:MAG: signal recognition particle protein, partial [Alphaproteobacteria bacterium]|nr:signal recognition particle protein [Alphaproteobacteria bacterium]